MCAPVCMFICREVGCVPVRSGRFRRRVPPPLPRGSAHGLAHGTSLSDFGKWKPCYWGFTGREADAALRSELIARVCLCIFVFVSVRFT